MAPYQLMNQMAFKFYLYLLYTQLGFSVRT